VKHILIVNDSPVLAAVMKAVVETEPVYQNVMLASSGQDALHMIQHNAVDIVLMDIHMPGMNGVETTRRILLEKPSIRVLITTATVTRNQPYVFQALQHGAVDFVRSPSLKVREGTRVSQQMLRAAGDNLLHKLAIITQMHSPSGKENTSLKRPFSRVSPPLKAHKHRPVAGAHLPAAPLAHPPKWLCIGSSTGGPTTLAMLLSALPQPFPGCIVVCQHIDAGFSQGMSRWLEDETGFVCHEVKGRVHPQINQLYMAPGGRNLLAMPGNLLTLREPPESQLFTPNINQLFGSMAHHHGARVCGVVLTGMGKDGAEGLADIQSLEGMVLAQDVDSAIIDSMPKAACKATGISGKNIGQIALAVTQWLKKT